MKRYAVSFMIQDNIIIGAGTVGVGEKYIIESSSNLCCKMSKGEKYGNIEVKNGKLVLTQGKINDYTIIGKDKNRVTDKLTAVLVGYQKFKGKVYYAMADNFGNVKCITGLKLSSFCKEHLGSNYTFKDKGEEVVIHPYTDNIEELHGEPKFKYYEKSGKLVIIINKLVDKLIVPNEINGNKVRAINSLVVNKDLLFGVEYLQLPEELSILDVSIFNRFGNLKELNMPSDIIDMNGALGNFIQGVQKMHIKSITRTSGLFNRCAELQNVTFDKQPYIYGVGTFIGCNKLSTTGLFKEGLIGMNGTFYNVDTLRYLRLPKSLKYIGVDSFDLCKNMNRLVITGNTLVGIPDKLKQFKVVDRKLLEDSTNAIIECPVDYPAESLKKMVGPNVHVIQTSKTPATKKYMETYKNMQEKIAKAVLMGMNVQTNVIASGINSIIQTLGIMDRESFKKQMTEAINAHALTYECNEIRQYLIGKYGLFVKVEIQKLDYTIGKVLKAHVSNLGNYVILIGSIFLIVIPIEPIKILNYLDSDIGRNENRHDIDTIVLPFYKYKAEDKELIAIEEIGDNLVLKFKDTEIEVKKENLHNGIY